MIRCLHKRAMSTSFQLLGAGLEGLEGPMANVQARHKVVDELHFLRAHHTRWDEWQY
jgi:hypothetical protein